MTTRGQARHTAEPGSRAGRSRAALIKAAADALIAGNGAVEIQDVARRAKVSIGLAYHRFGSKAGLIAAVVDHFYDQLELAIDLADVGANDWTAREHERLSRLVRFLYEHPLAEVVLSTLARDPEVAVVEAERWAELIAAAARNIAKAQERGQVSRGQDAAIIAALIMGGVRHAVSQALAAPAKPEPAALTRAVWTFITGGLALNARGGAVIPLKRRKG